jgi:hypothetical protein
MNSKHLESNAFVGLLPNIVANQTKTEAQRTIDQVKQIDSNHYIISVLEEILAKK